MSAINATFSMDGYKTNVLTWRMFCNFTRDEWNSHFSSFCCSQNFSLISCPTTMARRNFHCCFNVMNFSMFSQAWQLEKVKSKKRFFWKHNETKMSPQKCRVGTKITKVQRQSRAPERQCKRRLWSLRILY